MPNMYEQIGNYRLVSELNSDAFASVDKAQHSIFADDLAVAIKLLHAHLSSQQEHDQFIHEARLLKKLKHAHILPLIEAGVLQRSHGMRNEMPKHKRSGSGLFFVASMVSAPKRDIYHIACLLAMRLRLLARQPQITPLTQLFTRSI